MPVPDVSRLLFEGLSGIGDNYAKTREAQRKRQFEEQAPAAIGAYYDWLASEGGASSGAGLSRMADRGAGTPGGNKGLFALLAGPDGMASVNPTDLRVLGAFDAAGDSGATPSYYDAVRMAESGGNPAARSKTSTAGGDFGFLEGTWADVGRAHPELKLTPEGRFDPTQQEKAMTAFTGDNAKELMRARIKPTRGNLYLAHHFGAGGAKQLLGASDDTPVASLVGQDVMAANPHLAGKTVGVLKSWAAQKAGGDGITSVDASADAPADNGGWSGEAFRRPRRIPPKEAVMAMIRNPVTKDLGIEVLKSIHKGQDLDEYTQVQLADGSIAEFHRDTGKMSLVRDARKGGAAGEETFGREPIYGTDADGNRAMFTIGDRGTVRPLALPDGVSLSEKLTKVDGGTEWLWADPRSGQVVHREPKNIAGVEAAKVEGKARGENVAGLPDAIATGDRFLSMISDVRSDPGRQKGTGLTSYGNAFPASPGYDFQRKVDQLKGQAFLEAFKSLKGGGAISEKEGEQATAAIARLSTAQSEGAFIKALDDLEAIVRYGVENARRKAGVGGLAIPGGAPLGSGRTTRSGIGWSLGN